MTQAAESGIVNIHGKEYRTVAYRINEFRAAHPDYCIKTTVLCAAERVQVKATIKEADTQVGTIFRRKNGRTV